MEGRAGWRDVFPYEKGELLAVWRAALKTEGRAGGLHKKAVRRVAESGRAGCRKGQPSGPPFSVGQLNVQPAIPPFSATCLTAFLCSPPARPSIFSADRQKFTFFIWKHGPSARPPTN